MKRGLDYARDYNYKHLAKFLSDYETHYNTLKSVIDKS